MSKNLVNKHRTLRNETKINNKNNINIPDINKKDTSENNGRYGNHRHNKINDLRRKKQFIEEEKYDSDFFRHLRSIESRVKKYSNPKNKKIQGQTGTHHHQNRKHLPSKTTRPTKIQKTPKIDFSHLPKYRSTNIDTVDPSAFFSLFQKEITPLDDPT